MIELETADNDSHEFLHIASRLIAGAAVASDLSTIWAVHLKGFFGQAWLGFRGKILGSVGSHNRSLHDDLARPPFDSKRVLSVRCFLRHEDGSFRQSDLPYPTTMTVGSSNINAIYGKIGVKRLYAWYSSNTASLSKGAIMVYAIKDGRNAAWYTAWENRPPWTIVRNVGIATRTCRHFINLGTHPSAV
jgi:hypothetical protein